MQITITLDTNELSPQDLAFLRALTGESPAPAAAPKGDSDDKPAAPAKKAAAKKTETKKTEPEPDADDADAGEDEDGEDDSFLQQAIELATKVVSEGGAKKVKSALDDHGAKRVSELKEDQIESFIAAISD